MTISVIIPTCNRPDFLMEALKSVWQQTLLPDEILIGDDSKDDVTEKLVREKLIPKSKVPIKYFHHKPSLLQAGNVDFLIQSVSTDLLLLLHDDDALLTECLEILISPLAASKDVVASFGKQFVMDDNGKLVAGGEKHLNDNAFRTTNNVGVVDGEWAAVIGMFPNNAFLIRSKIAKEIGYNDNSKAGDAIDFYFGYRVGKNNKFVFIDEFTAKYRLSSASISRGSLRLLSSKLQILLEELTPEKLSNTEIKKTVHFLLNPAISEAIKRGDKKLALKWMFSSHYNLFTLKGYKRIAMCLNLYR